MRRIAIASGAVTTVAGTPNTGCSSSGDFGLAIAARVSYPTGVVADGTGACRGARSGLLSDLLARAFSLPGGFFIVEGGKVRYVSAAGIITTVAGNGLSNSGVAQAQNGNGGPATLARFNNPQAVYPDPLMPGAVLISGENHCFRLTCGGMLPACLLFLQNDADFGTNWVRRLLPNGTMQLTGYIGNGLLGYTGNGAAASAANILQPVQLALDGLGGCFIAVRNPRHGRCRRGHARSPPFAGVWQ